MESDESLFKVTQWDFKEMVPMQAFCNWQFKIEGFEANKSVDSLTKLGGYEVTVSMVSQTKTDFGLVSAKKKEFDFSSVIGGKEMDLVRFAQLDPRVIVADSNRNSTEPIDFQIIVNVTKTVLEPV